MVRGASRLVRTVATLLKKNPILEFPIGLEKDGQTLLKPDCPPYYATMEVAVRAVVDWKFGARGIFRSGIAGGWMDPKPIASAADAVSERVVDAVISYATYVYETYGRFPAYPAPFRTSVGFQAAHLDLGFYEKFYRPEALGDAHRTHDAIWHPR